MYYILGGFNVGKIVPLPIIPAQQQDYKAQLTGVCELLREIADTHNVSLRTVFSDLSYVVIADDILDHIQNEKK